LEKKGSFRGQGRLVFTTISLNHFFFGGKDYEKGRIISEISFMSSAILSIGWAADDFWRPRTTILHD